MARVYTKPDLSLPTGARACTQCSRVLPFSEFHKNAGGLGGTSTVCKGCKKARMAAYHATVSKQKRMLGSAKYRAAKYGRDFNIELSDIVIPTLCPVLGIPMDRPSLDRIDGTKGYVKGNVRVISHRANMLKNDATIEELELVLKDLKGLSNKQL